MNPMITLKNDLMYRNDDFDILENKMNILEMYFLRIHMKNIVEVLFKDFLGYQNHHFRRSNPIFLLIAKIFTHFYTSQIIN